MYQSNLCTNYIVEIKKKSFDKPERDWNSANISIRLSGDEAVRWYTLFDKAETIYPRVRNTDVLRELLRLDAPQLLTEDDIVYFQTGAKSPTVVREVQDKGTIGGDTTKTPLNTKKIPKKVSQT